MPAPGPSTHAEGRRWALDPAWMGTAAVLLLTGIIRARHLNLPLERDEGEFAYMGRLILEGIPPYRLAYNMKFPGTYYLYALFMRIFGATVAGIHLGLLFANLLATLLVYRLGKRLLDGTSGAAAAAVYGFMTVSSPLLGTSAHATQFLVPFVLLAFLLLLERPEEMGGMSRRFGIGWLFGFAVCVKQHAALFAILGFLQVLRGGAPAGRGPLKDRILSALALAAGALSPIALVMLGMAWTGDFPRFWYWTITYARQYVAILSPREAWASFLVNAPRAVEGWTPVLASALGGLLAVLLDPGLRKARWALLAFLLFSAASVCPGFYFRQHYFVTLVPAIALLSGALVHSLSRLLERRWAFRQGALVLLGLALAFPLLTFRTEFFEAPDQALSKFDYPYGCFWEMRVLGERLKAEMGPGDQLAVLGSEPELFFYSGCRSASGYLYLYPLMEPQPLARRMQEDMAAQIERSRPRFVVLVDNNTSWLVRPDSEKFILAWLDGFLAKGYHVIGKVECRPDSTAFRLSWGKEALAPRPRSPLGAIVFERS